jgi:chromosome segregation ATPase
LESARHELVVSMRKLREMDIRFAKTFDELSQKETELNKKAELLDAAEESRSHLESTIRKLQVEVKGLKNKVDFLEIERDNLQCQSESQAHLQTSQINTLEAVLESVTKEKETSKEHYEKLLEQADAREKSLRQELTTKFNELEFQYNNLKEFVDESEAFGPESAKMLEEVGMLRAQKIYLEDEIANLHAQLADDKQKVKEDSSSSLTYLSEVSKAVESIRKNVENNVNAQSSKMSDDKQEKESDQPKNEIHIVLSKLIQVEKDVQSIILEKNEAQSKLIRLEEENRNFALRLNEFVEDGQKDELSQIKDKYEKVMHQLENEKTKSNQLQEKLNNKGDAKVEELSRKNKILMELIEYQKGPVDNEVDKLLAEIGNDDISQEELHEVFEKYEKLKKPGKTVETREVETK